jgi:hypothetical protein
VRAVIVAVAATLALPVEGCADADHNQVVSELGSTNILAIDDSALFRGFESETAHRSGNG